MRVRVGGPPSDWHLYNAFVDGEDVSRRCFAADDEEGWADVYVLDEDGYPLVANGDLVRERLTGAVRLERR